MPMPRMIDGATHMARKALIDTSVSKHSSHYFVLEVDCSLVLYGQLVENHSDYYEYRKIYRYGCGRNQASRNTKKA